MTGRLSMWPAVFGIALAMILVTVVEPVTHSLAYASSAVVLIALLGWILEARDVAGPPPEVEPEHEEEETPPGLTYWPFVLALGIVGIAVGLLWAWEYSALIAAIPLALSSSAGWMSAVQQDAESTPAPDQTGPAIVTASGKILTPVSDQVLTTQAAGGAAIALERTEVRQVSRRGLLRLTFWTGLLAGLGAIAGATIDMLYPRGITGFGSLIAAGNASQFPPGTRTEINAGKFWLVHLSDEQARISDPENGKAGFLALWWKCPHLGCTIPFRANHTFAERRGWFLCPCHGSTYDNAGVRVFGPAPRSMDRMEVMIDRDSGRISVNTGAISKGTTDNAKFAVEG